MSSSPRVSWAIVLLSAAFALWAAGFIFSASFIAGDGDRYFCLFDDALISMRYADNLAHGHGLVWNVGERVEGYSNLLMTLLMALPSALLEKRLAVLAVQIFGLFVTLGIAWASLRLADELARFTPDLDRRRWRVAGFALGFAYYPLVYWTLMGMETGLVTLLLIVCLVAALSFLRGLDWRCLAVLALAGGLAFLTRPDSAVITGPLVLLTVGRGWREPQWSRRALLAIASLYLLMPATQMVFRAVYYGTLAPVTYTLKLGGMPFGLRLENGFAFVRPFLGQTWPLFAAAGLGALASRDRRRLVALGVPLALVAYQVSIGGAPSPYWRFLAPGVPVLLILALFGTHSVARWALGRGASSPRRATVAGLALLLVVVLAANRPFLPEILFKAAPDFVEDNQGAVNTALAIRELTHHTATVGVFMAGVVPYYTERPAIDFLGKCDPYVAALPPDLSGAVAWQGMSSVPGHNKYDLQHSIVSLRPTYIEGYRWGRQNLSEWARARYEAVFFKGQRLLFLRDSPFVDWRKARRRGSR